MDLYRQLYAFLVSQIDDALSLLDTGDLLEIDHVREILSSALETAEERYWRRADFSPGGRERSFPGLPGPDPDAYRRGLPSPGPRGSLLYAQK